MHSVLIAEVVKLSIRTYSKLIQLPTFEERYRYLILDGRVGETTFGGHRQLNQSFYQSTEWKRIRDQIFIRDNGCDLACPDRPIGGRLVVHHLNPLTIEDFTNRSLLVTDPEYLICVSHETHNALHCGSEPPFLRDYVPRSQNDTCPWRC